MSSSIFICAERPDAPVAAKLIAELDDHLASRYAAESRHGFSVEKLIRDNVAFFVMWSGPDRSTALGCGGILLVPARAGDSAFAEVKRMYVRPEHRGKGLGRRMLEHLQTHACEQGFDRLRLETGIHQREARALYEGFGFVQIGAFPPYRSDPMSVFYQKTC